MWGLFNNALQFNTLPAILVDVTDPYLAYCLNEAVITFGNTIQHELDKITDKNPKTQERKRRNKLLQLLGVPAEQRFRRIG